jgi:hypothetical protein
MKIKIIKKIFGKNDTNSLLNNVIDKHIKQLSKMQVDLLYTDVSTDDYNEISLMIGNLKEYMINCRSHVQ